MAVDRRSIVRWLLRLIGDEEERALIRDDLSEEYESEVEPRLGHRVADIWLLAMALRSVTAWWRVQLRFWGSGLGMDIVASSRGLRRTGWLSLVVLASIALGVGTMSAVLTLYSSAILRPLPFPDSDRLVRIWNDEPGAAPRSGLSWADVRDIQAQLRTIDTFVATLRARLTVLGDDGARRAQGEGVTRGYLELLGVEPALGRLLSESDHAVNADPVIVLTFDLWQTQLGGDPNVLGSVIRTTSKSFTIVGVAQRGFRGTIENDLLDHEFWVPIEQVLGVEETGRRGAGNIWTIGRLADGATLAQARSEVAAIDARLTSAFPEARSAQALLIEPMGESWRSQHRTRDQLLVLAAALLLAVAICNVAGLMIVRTASRKRELAVRDALGAGRGRLVRLVALETTLLACAGGALGLLAAAPILRGFLGVFPAGLPAYVQVRPDLPALALSLLALGLAAITAAVATAALGTRVDIDGVLRSGGRGATLPRGERRRGEWIIAGEIALATVLIATAGLVGRSLEAMTRADLGYRTDHLLRMAMTIDARDVAEAAEMPAFLDRLRATVAEYPGVARVGLTWQALPPGYETSRRVWFDGMPPTFVADGVPVGYHAIDSDLLPTLGIGILAGRGFTAGEVGSRQRAVIVCESLARMMGGLQRAIGRSVTYEGQRYTVVGVAADVMYQGPVKRRERDLDVYVPLTLHAGSTISIAVLTETDPLDYAGPLQGRLGALAPASAQHWISTMGAEIADDLGGPFFHVVLLTAFAVSALSLMAVGLFAVVAYQITSQRSEFGVRRAIGATRARVLAVVAWRGLRPVAAGVLAGGFGSLPVGRILSATLYGVGPFDWVTLAGSAACVLCVGGLVCALCAMEAWRIGPHEALV